MRSVAHSFGGWGRSLAVDGGAATIGMSSARSCTGDITKVPWGPSAVAGGDILG